MICDWEGMSRKFGGTVEQFFDANNHKMVLHEKTISLIHKILSED